MAKTAVSHPAINGGSCGVIGKVTLYNQRNEIIGSIYPRRAKQLVLGGRAVWLDEGRVLQTMPNETGTSSAFDKEEVSMVSESAYSSNGEREKPDRVFDEADALLLYRAKQNVRDKANLIKHIVAYLISLPILGVFFVTVFMDRALSFPHPQWWRFNGAFRHVWDIMPYLPEEHGWAVFNLWDTAELILQFDYTPRVWYVIVGVMIAWGFWILRRLVKFVIRPAFKRFWVGSAKKAKPDPIILEYNRLKNAQ